eukprot:RCo035079
MSKATVLALRCTGIAGLGAIGFVGVYCLIKCGENDMKTVMMLVWLPVFAVIGMLTELGWSGALAKFGFMRSWVVKGILYIFLGTIAIGNQVYGWVVGVFMIAFGVVLLLLNFKFPHFLDDGEGDTAGTPTPAAAATAASGRT